MIIHIGQTPESENIFSIGFSEHGSIGVALTHYIQILKREKPYGWRKEIKSIHDMQKVLDRAWSK